MRVKNDPQISLFEFYGTHETGQQLKRISAWLDAHPLILDIAEHDLGFLNKEKTGRKGLSVDSIVRATLLKQMMGLTYEELSFYLSDSSSYRSFSRICSEPSASSLQANISQLSADTWEKINHQLLATSARQGIEKGRTIRIDSTVTQTHIHAPTDSSLLWDCVRAMVRLLRLFKGVMPAGSVPYCNHSRTAKRQAYAIQFARGAKMKKCYQKLLTLTQYTKEYLHDMLTYKGSVLNPMRYTSLKCQAQELLVLTGKVMSQTQRRVMNGEKVPVIDKVCSIFEPHSDIIVKGGRDVQYGHKLNLITGRSGLLLDIVIEQGNPSDTSRLCPMIDRQQSIYGRVPRQVAADGGYASQDNLKAAKAQGVTDVAFQKKRGLNIEDMVKSTWVYKRLCQFRAGVEGNISCLKRRYGLGRCHWRGVDKFKMYVWSSSVAYNLTILAAYPPPE